MATSSPTFDRWLESVVAKASEPNGAEDLQRWLEGYSLPDLDKHTEGHMWLLEAVKDVPELGPRIASLAANLIEDQCQEKLKTEHLSQLLSNLFYLCRGLRTPAILWGPLLDLLNAHTVPNPNGEWGRYKGVPLITAFRGALAANQGDDSLQVMWQKMLSGQPDEFLRGTPMDGFEGLLGLPSKAREGLVAWALARMSDYLNKSPFREAQFRQLLRSVSARWKEVAWDFQVLGIRGGWQSWAKDTVGGVQGLMVIDYSDVKYPKVESDPPPGRILLPEDYSRHSATLEPLIREHCEDYKNANLPPQHLETAIKVLAAKAGCIGE
jgi:hypothetical protein